MCVYIYIYTASSKRTRQDAVDEPKVNPLKGAIYLLIDIDIDIDMDMDICVCVYIYI